MKKTRARATTPALRFDYLRSLGVDTDSALQLLVHDLVSTGVLPDNEAQAAVRIRAREHLEAQHEMGLEVTALETAVWVSEAVQEDIIEGLGPEQRVTNWPSCPRHPQHPLWLVEQRQSFLQPPTEPSSDPFWTCITDDEAIAELGRL